MRWDALFDDLEAQAAVLAQAERAAEVEERARAEIGGLTTVDRLRVAVGTPLRLQLTGDTALAGRVTRVGPDWLLLDEGSGREAVVVAGHLLGVRGLGRYSAVPGSAGIVESRLGLRSALRGLARDRSPVRLHRLDGSALDATLDRVGADFVDVATHAAGEPRRRGEVRGVELVPIAAITALRRSV